MHIRNGLSGKQGEAVLSRHPLRAISQELARVETGKHAQNFSVELSVF